jgi:hypothetical protein
MPRIIPPSVYEFVAGASADAKSDMVPFWQSDSEGVAEEGMYLLAMELDLPDTAQLLAGLPVGYGMVFSIFNWEQSRAGEGFATGIDNSGVELVDAAAQAYDLVGMGAEANALRRVLAQYAQTPQDYEVINAAYENTPNPYQNDWDRIPHLVRTLCAGADGYFYAEA